MGHYASEMDPDWGRRIDETNEQIKLRDKLKNVPLSAFTAGDLPALIQLMSDGDSIGLCNIFCSSKKDLKRLKAKLKKHKQDC